MPRYAANGVCLLCFTVVLCISDASVCMYLYLYSLSLSLNERIMFSSFVSTVYHMMLDQLYYIMFLRTSTESFSGGNYTGWL